jgi:hypothetical protein
MARLTDTDLEQLYQSLWTTNTILDKASGKQIPFDFRALKQRLEIELSRHKQMLHELEQKKQELEDIIDTQTRILEKTNTTLQ